MMSNENKTRLVILISGRGSNMRSIIEAIDAQQIDATVSAVISNRPDAAGLDYAKAQSITTAVVDHKTFSDRDSFDKALAERIDDYKPDFVILAGFMRILTSGFVKHYRNKLINIHPSLLPKFKGLNTHQRAIDAGEKEHGASVHFVTAELDDGPVIMQAKVNILADDSAESLAARVLEQEHQLYPAAIQKLVKSKQD
ncbi:MULTISPECIES: phosphoribosylglycinamide formyltransferase [unclassified Methylophaga]|jgi:phosphoribosylglycinamide formyltransferase-1|uniref:phosphoribosylglycinamide formyltransferase n=4 Tax=Methylophaga TaxID=40222 RepID=UPI00259CF206|nr:MULTISPECIES: phosphoribosylglycinamide formyltransferase [unclassified Methylophaga]|tara:strand:+ start:4419 stop:5012 length:594 start_codon:yes stop_codon:yes gene_type:complete